jgi:hypothetical protein
MTQTPAHRVDRASVADRAPATSRLNPDSAGEMRDIIRELPNTVCDDRGAFHVSVVASEAEDRRWEAWLEFVDSERGTSEVYATPIETRQHDRAAVERWASGVTQVYVEGALTRAALGHAPQFASPLLHALGELIAALDRRMPQMDRLGETDITADAACLRASAMRRAVMLRQQMHAGFSPAVAELAKDHQ